MIKKYLLVFATLSIVVMLTIGYLAMRMISSEDPPIFRASQKISKTMIMQGLDHIERYFGTEKYAPTPFDSTDFSYADLSHPYFEKIRSDKRVAHFYTDIKQNNPIDFSDAIAMKEYLRNLFIHKEPSKGYENTHVLEMIDATTTGETFKCGNIARMLVELIQAGGTQARKIELSGAKNGHVVMEFWSKQWNKWIMLDPDYNVYYTDVAGMPLSSLEIYEMSQDKEKRKEITVFKGNSPNTLYNNDTDLVTSYYQNGVAICFYNRWVDKNLPRRNPARSPAIMGYYVGKLSVEKLYYNTIARLLMRIRV
jgi:hypothetical protein